MNKRVYQVLFAVAVMCLALLYPSKSEAATASQNWVGIGDGWFVLEGTDVKMEIKPEVVHVTGNGAIPDYSIWEFNKRPWANCNCKSIIIDDTITSVGEYVFAELPDLQYITMSSKTFIAGPKTFDKIPDRPIFRIFGTDARTEMIGTIPYTSMDSIKLLAQSGYKGAAYVMDNAKVAKEFQESANPTITHVYSATDEKAPWNNVDANGNGNEYKSICSLSPSTPNILFVVTGMKKYQGKGCYHAFASAIEDYTFIANYEIAVSLYGKSDVLKDTGSAYRYVLTIPKEYRQAGRSFRLMKLEENGIAVYEDLDTIAEVITFETTAPSGTYALCYKDAQ